MTSMLQEDRQIRDQRDDRWPRDLTADLAYLRTAMVNLYFVGQAGAGDRGWVLIDAGLPGYAGTIAEAAGRRFGRGARPSAIVLTHGHFDHVGSLESLVRTWDVPVYAHELELPYLTGRSPYPPPDPTVGGGLLAALSWMYPRGPIDLGDRVRRLPEDGTVPEMPGWRWVHTPGHSTGHISLFRDSDRTLIVGDAFVTTKQESALAVLEQRQEIHGPPAYFTSDWGAARRSVERLAALEPRLAATGHGLPMSGQALRTALGTLSRDFDRIAVPEHGRYVGHPAITDADGVIAVPPDVSHPLPRLMIGFGAGVVAGLAIEAMIHPEGRRGRRRGS